MSTKHFTLLEGITKTISTDHNTTDGFLPCKISELNCQKHFTTFYMLLSLAHPPEQQLISHDLSFFTPLIYLTTDHIIPFKKMQNRFAPVNSICRQNINKIISCILEYSHVGHFLHCEVSVLVGLLMQNQSIFVLESIYVSWYDCGQHFSHPADFTEANDIMFPVTPCPGPRYVS